MAERISIPIGTVQRWGNFGSHPSDVAELLPSAVDACLASLRDVVDWYEAG